MQKLTKAIGILTAVTDISERYTPSNMMRQCLRAALLALSEGAGTATGTAALKTIGITSTAYVTAVIVAFTVWRESEKALANETKSRQLGSMYASIEIMLRTSHPAAPLEWVTPFLLHPEISIKSGKGLLKTLHSDSFSGSM